VSDAANEHASFSSPPARGLPGPGILPSFGAWQKRGSANRKTRATIFNLFMARTSNYTLAVSHCQNTNGNFYGTTKGLPPSVEFWNSYTVVSLPAGVILKIVP
jgi:hypothetical protein